MLLDTILTELRSERDRLDRAIAALEGSTTAAKPSPSPAVSRGIKRPRHKMSADARKRISDAKKAWWAKKKKKKAAQ